MTQTQIANPTDASRSAYVLEVEVGTLTFSNLNGDFVGTAEILLSDRRHSQIKCTLNDEAQELWSQLDGSKASEVSVRVGYLPDNVHEVLKGKLYWVGRIPPDKVMFEVLDSAFELNQSTVSRVNESEDEVDGEGEETESSEGEEAETDVTDEALAALPGATPEPAEAAETGEADPNSVRAGVLLQEASEAATGGRPKKPQVENATETIGMEFENRGASSTSGAGQPILGRGALRAAQDEAARRGEIISSDGDTISQTAPGQAKDTGIIINWERDKDIFVRPPRIKKKTPYHVQGAGAMSVSGWDVAGKNSVGATVVTTNQPPPLDPQARANVPEWGEIRLSDPIYEGCSYTWADATRNGERVPESKAVMEGIVAIAKFIQFYTDRYGEGKWQINSWYRDPATNMSVSSSGANGPHTTGTAVDVNFPSMQQFHDELAQSHQGGVAIYPGVFAHVDLIGYDPAKGGVAGDPGRRWSYV